MNWTEFELLTKEQLYEMVTELEDDVKDEIEELKFKLSCSED